MNFLSSVSIESCDLAYGFDGTHVRDSTFLEVYDDVIGSPATSNFSENTVVDPKKSGP